MDLFQIKYVILSYLAVILAAIFKVYVVDKNKEVFLNLPAPLGFMAYNLVGGNGGRMPPYFDTDLWTDGRYRDWLRDGDVVVATMAKAGTTWMCYCTDAVRRKGRDDIGHPYTDIMYTTPWMEVHQVPGMPWHNRSELMNSTVLPNGNKLKDYWDHPAYPFRVFKSHYTPIPEHEFDVTKKTGPKEHEFSVLPVREMPEVRFIAAARNPFEVAKSIHTFFPKHTDEFKKTWGGFPPNYANSEAAMKDMLAGGNLYGLLFPYLRAWWPFRDDPNVLFLHYSDMVKDTPGLVKKLAKFLGVELTAEEESLVAEKCSFAHMKKNGDLFNYQNPAKPGSSIMKGDFIGTGKAGKDNDPGISEAALRSFGEVIEKEWPDADMRRWAQEGGAFEEA